MAVGMSEQTEPEDQATPRRPLIKRRWAIVTKAGGGAAVLAVAGALALSDPVDQSDSAQDSGGADSHISAEA
ncbi:MAG: hypothetical protein ACHQJ5_11305 [Vicinamibacteria bacterium]